MTYKASTIREFCEQHRISVALFYELQKEGKTPRVTRLGPQKLIIFDDDAAAWRRAMAEASPQQVTTAA